MSKKPDEVEMEEEVEDEEDILELFELFLPP
jgi:hypothetical protein